MPYPTKYTRQYGFQGYQDANPSRPLPGDKVDYDLNTVALSSDEVVEFLKLHTRSDGLLKNGVVSMDSLGADVLSAIALGDAEALASAVAVTPAGGITATNVQDALEELDAALAGAGAVSSVFGRTGAVTATAGDYTATQVTNTPAGNIAATTVQAALNELDTEKLAAASYTAADVLSKLLTVDGAGSGLDADLLDGQSSAAFQPVDADLTALAAAASTGAMYTRSAADTWTAVTGSNDDLLQKKAGQWTNRTVAQLLADLAAVGTTFQPLDTDLTAIAALTRNRGDLIRGGASGWEDFAASTADTFVGGDGTDVTTRTAAQVRTSLGIEFGTFTPTLTFATPGNLSVTYAEQTGWYTRLPSARVLFGIRLAFTATHTTASGAMRVAGLPSAGNGTWVVGQIENDAVITYPAGRTAVMGQVISSQTYLQFLAVGSAVNQTYIQASNVTSAVATGISITGAYLSS